VYDRQLRRYFDELSRYGQMVIIRAGSSNFGRIAYSLIKIAFVSPIQARLEISSQKPGGWHRGRGHRAGPP
jgi:hypothetical protein